MHQHNGARAGPWAGIVPKRLERELKISALLDYTCVYFVWLRFNFGCIGMCLFAMLD